MSNTISLSNVIDFCYNFGASVLSAFHLPGKARRLDGAEGLFEALTVFGEVARSKNGIGDFEQRFFVALEIDFAAGGAADVRLGEQQSCEAKHLDAVFGRQRRNIAGRKACSFYRQQEVDGHRIGIDFQQFKKHVHHVFGRFAHADDAAGANLKTETLEHFQVVDSFLVSVRGADVRVKTTAAVQVVIDAVEACLFKN